MHRAVQHRLLSTQLKIYRPCSRSVSGRRHPTRSRSFHRTSRDCAPKEPQDPQDASNPTESGGDRAASDDTNPFKPVAGNGQSATALDKIPQKSLTYYGSAARRQLRRNSPKESEQPIPLPNWFVESHVLLGETLKFDKNESTIQVLYSAKGMGWIGEPKASPDQVAAAIRKQKETTNSEAVSVKDWTAKHSLPGIELTPVPLPGKRYFLEKGQNAEVEYTMRGLLRLPLPEFAGEVASEKSHLILHYPAEGGSFLLDELVRKTTKSLGCDLISLDAQDISELVASSPGLLESPPEEFMHASRLLSYEVYHKDSNEPEDYGPDEDEDAFDFDQSGESARPRGFRMGRSMIVAKPITMNLSDLLGSAIGGSTSRGRSRLPRPFLGGVNGEAQQRPKSPKHLLANLIDALVSAPLVKRHAKLVSGSDPETSHDKDEVENPAVTSVVPLNTNGLVIHVKDLRAIQDTQFGRQFLSTLYENVQNRRASREKIIIVGTECSSDDRASYSKTRIQDMQRGELEEISRTIVVTPVLPNTDAKLAILEDKKRRVRMLNVRHFLEQYRQKEPKALEQLPEEFWKQDPAKYLDIPDWSLLDSSVMSFGQIHRLASLMAGMKTDGLNLSGRLKQCLWHLSASDKIKISWAEQGRVKEGNRQESKEGSTDSRINKIRKSATKHEKRLLGGVIEPDKIRTTFNDVHAPIETIDALKTLTTLSLIRPEAFLYGVLASDKIPGLLLYGPPGTGKTLLAKAVAKESGATVLEVSAAEINDMYVGEGEKNVKAVFSLAKKLSPCVIFIDEADALFSARTGRQQRVSHRELLNQFLKEWDGMSNDSAGAFIMVATNRPMDLDDAVLRRLPRRLLVDLPTERDRLEILKIHLRDEQLAQDVDLSDLASKTPFYSGSDLKNLAVAAALSCVREENDLAKKHNAASEEPYKHAEKRTLTAQHFTRALEEITASISEDMTSLKDIKKFDEQYGDKRGKKKKASKWGFNAAIDKDKVLDTVKVRG